MGLENCRAFEKKGYISPLTMFIPKRSTLTYVEACWISNKGIGQQNVTRKSTRKSFLSNKLSKEAWRLGLAKLSCKLVLCLTNSFGREKKRKSYVKVETFNFDILASVLKLIYKDLILIRRQRNQRSIGSFGIWLKNFVHLKRTTMKKKTGFIQQQNLKNSKSR